jgi:hypothetical protein
MDGGHIPVNVFGVVRSEVFVQEHTYLAPDVALWLGRVCHSALPHSHDAYDTQSEQDRASGDRQPDHQDLPVLFLGGLTVSRTLGSGQC